ncbi:MAG: triphosphoribosyl-dephospho-CoA synthase [Candidatus Melainabacteria bacterium]|nr:triphosphoribosyl-dephospho-CoA synthase [Candidatus Melainabacteria bacterium]
MTAFATPKLASFNDRRQLFEPLQEDERSMLLARLGRQALIAELALTPKPALVDGRGSGRHSDLSYETMSSSAYAIEPFLKRMAQIACGRQPSQCLREELASIGRLAEAAMFRATAGSNSHKGAIWSLGLLCAASAMQPFDDQQSGAIAATAGSIASFADRCRESSVPSERNGLHKCSNLELVTHGHIVQMEYGAPGARGEAQQGFPHITKIGLPALHKRRQEGAVERVARLDCLLSIMSQLDDTCVLYRGGRAALDTVQIGAATVLARGGAGSKEGMINLLALDQKLLELRCSPGGSADLLSATLFLDALENGQNEIT